MHVQHYRVAFYFAAAMYPFSRTSDRYYFYYQHYAIVIGASL